MSTTVSSTPADLASTLRRLGVDPSTLASRAETANAVKASNVSARERQAIIAALSSFSRAELSSVQSLMGAPTAGEIVPVSGNPLSYVGELTLPQVSALLKKYGVEAPTPLERPLERYLALVGKIDEFCAQEKDPEKLADLMVQKDLRRTVFLLEGLLKMYKPGFGDDVSKLRDDVKKLEDALGGVSLYRGVDGKGLIKTAQDKGMPVAVIRELETKYIAAMNDLTELVAEQWAPNGDEGQSKRIGKLIEKVVDEDFGSYDDDRAYLSKEVAEHIAEIEGIDYDTNDLQGEAGLHELRRQLRWIPVMVEATGGLMQLSETQNPIPSLSSILDTELAKSKYVQLPPADREANPVSLSKSLYTANMQAVLELGKVKDIGEAVEHLGQAYVDSGVAATLADGEAQVKALLGEEYEMGRVHGAASKLYGELTANGLLPAMRAELEQAV
ncbi:MAG: hypothetical protein ACT4TC_03060 [Myxococcaceae bacterium]